MIPAAFDYQVAAGVDEAISLLGENTEAKLIAGGHSLLPLMKLRFAQPSLLVDIGRVEELSYVRDAGDAIAVGALARHADVAGNALLQESCSVVAETAAQVGDPQVRHRGTIGGSVAHADPASDLPTVLLALDAEFVARGPDGERTIAAGEFFTGFLESALTQQEILTEIRVPKLDGPAAYVKYNRRAQDWATVGVAAVRNGGSTTVALTNMGATPLRATGTEAAVAAGATAADAAARAADDTRPPSATNGSAEYRRHLAAVLTRRALEALAG
ncbi:MAG: FAD binding domain-containing protein [Gaiellaceae bacterium]